MFIHDFPCRGSEVFAYRILIASVRFVKKYFTFTGTVQYIAIDLIGKLILS